MGGATGATGGPSSSDAGASTESGLGSGFPSSFGGQDLSGAAASAMGSGGGGSGTDFGAFPSGASGAGSFNDFGNSPFGWSPNTSFNAGVDPTQAAQYALNPGSQYDPTTGMANQPAAATQSGQQTTPFLQQLAEQLGFGSSGGGSPFPQPPNPAQAPAGSTQLGPSWILPSDQAAVANPPMPQAAPQQSEFSDVGTYQGVNNPPLPAGDPRNQPINNPPLPAARPDQAPQIPMPQPRPDTAPQPQIAQAQPAPPAPQQDVQAPVMDVPGVGTVNTQLPFAGGGGAPAPTQETAAIPSPPTQTQSQVEAQTPTVANAAPKVVQTIKEPSIASPAPETPAATPPAASTGNAPASSSGPEATSPASAAEQDKAFQKGKQYPVGANGGMATYLGGGKWSDSPTRSGPGAGPLSGAQQGGDQQGGQQGGQQFGRGGQGINPGRAFMDILGMIFGGRAGMEAGLADLAQQMMGGAMQQGGPNQPYGQTEGPPPANQNIPPAQPSGPPTIPGAIAPNLPQSAQTSGKETVPAAETPAARGLDPFTAQISGVPAGAKSTNALSGGLPGTTAGTKTADLSGGVPASAGLTSSQSLPGKPVKTTKEAAPAAANNLQQISGATGAQQTIPRIAQGEVRIPSWSRAGQTPASMRPSQPNVDRSRFGQPTDQQVYQLAWMVNGELPSNKTLQSKIVQVETVYNRAMRQGVSLDHALRPSYRVGDGGYYDALHGPGTGTYRTSARPTARDLSEMKNIILPQVLNPQGGSNFSDIGWGPMDGNASAGQATKQWRRGELGYQLHGGDTYFIENRGRLPAVGDQMGFPPQPPPVQNYGLATAF